MAQAFDVQELGGGMSGGGLEAAHRPPPTQRLHKLTCGQTTQSQRPRFGGAFCYSIDSID